MRQAVLTSTAVIAAILWAVPEQLLQNHLIHIIKWKEYNNLLAQTAESDKKQKYNTHADYKHVKVMILFNKLWWTISYAGKEPYRFLTNYSEATITLRKATYHFNLISKAHSKASKHTNSILLYKMVWVTKKLKKDNNNA